MQKMNSQKSSLQLGQDDQNILKMKQALEGFRPGVKFENLNILHLQEALGMRGLHWGGYNYKNKNGAQEPKTR